jgi:PAS domain S-box-containing protein
MEDGLPGATCGLCSKPIGPGTASRGGDSHLRCSLADARLKAAAQRNWASREQHRALRLTRAARDLTAELSLGQDLARFQLAAIVQSSDDAIVGTDLDGIVQSWNAGAARIFGYGADEMVGRSIKVIVPPERHPEEEHILARIRQGERVEHFETVRRRKDGSLIDVSVTVSPVNDRYGRVIGASKIARDISARKRDEREREELLARERAARAEADAANRTKDEFLAMVSHEFRTPLNGVTGWLNVLRSKRAEPAHVERALDAIDRNARLLTKIVDDLLDMSRFVAGTIALERAAVDVCPVVETVLTTLQPLAAEKGVLLESALDPWAGPVFADSGRLQQVFGNILVNAIKFTPSGGRVDVHVQNDAEDVMIAFKDTGQGMSPDFLPHAFEAFRQGDPTASRALGGLGLGLAIVHHLVTLHGGTVTVQSAGIGHGCCVTVRLPRMEGPLFGRKIL